jgi:hypothetical protein
MKNNTLKFTTLNEEQAFLIKEYCRLLKYKSIINNKDRTIKIIDGKGYTYLVIIKFNKLYLFRRKLIMSITETKLKEIRMFVNGFNHLNIHINFIQIIYGTYLFTQKNKTNVQIS